MVEAEVVISVGWKTGTMGLLDMGGEKVVTERTGELTGRLLTGTSDGTGTMGCR